jgi:hypothetical protein
MANLVYLSNNLQIADNLVPKIYNFETDYTYTVIGTGTAENIAGLSYSGTRSLRLNNLDNQNTDLTVSLFITPVALENSGYYNLSFYLYNGVFESGDLIQMEIYKGGVLFATWDLEPYDVDVPSTVTLWKRYAQVFNNSGGLNNYTFKIIMKANGSSITSDKSIYIDAFKVELNDKGVGFPTVYTEPLDTILTVTETIDVTSIASGDTEAVTIVLTGAEVGDNVSLIYPAELITLGLIVGYPIVTDVDEVKFLILNPTGGALDPASGDYTLKIVK